MTIATMKPVKIRRTLVGGSNKMIVYDDLDPLTKSMTRNGQDRLDAFAHAHPFDRAFVEPVCEPSSVASPAGSSPCDVLPCPDDSPALQVQQNRHQGGPLDSST